MNPLGMTDAEYSAWLEWSMNRGSYEEDPDENYGGAICRAGFFNIEDPFTECRGCEHPSPYGWGCQDGYLHRPMYGASEDEITEATRIIIPDPMDLLQSIGEANARDYYSY